MIHFDQSRYPILVGNGDDADPRVYSEIENHIIARQWQGAGYSDPFSVTVPIAMYGLAFYLHERIYVTWVGEIAIFERKERFAGLKPYTIMLPFED